MPATDLIISEYVEGSSNNKALEFYNGTGAAVSLTGYQLLVYFNGSASAGLTINLTGTVAAGDVFVLAHSSANAAILAQADQVNGAGWFNGDDAIVLVKSGVVVDSFGQVGVDPGTEWGSGLASTADNTLRRMDTITSGDTNPFDAFSPASQWNGFATDTFGGLGSHSTVAQYGISPLSADKPEGQSGITQYTFTVTRPDGTAAESIGWSVGVTGGLPEDADPSDFTAGVLPSGTVEFAAGELSKVITIQVNGDLTNEVDESFTVTLGVPSAPSATGTIRNDDVILTEIADIQGAAHLSPLAGQTVSAIGIVTAVTGNGFWIQDETPDADAATSDGIFVFTSSAPSAAIVRGAEVRVTGRVTEFFPNSDTSAELSLTEIAIGATGSVQLTGDTGTIAATLVGVGGLLPPTSNYGDDDNAFDPATEGLDFWESLEGMLVTLNDAVASGPSDTNGFNDSQVFVSLDGATNAPLTPNGGLIAQPGDFNPERIAVQEDNRVFNNDFTANVGDGLGDVTGVVNYERGGFFEVIATSGFAVAPGGIARESTTELAAADDQLTIASYNAENLAVGNPQSKFDEIAGQIVSGMRSPDIIALQEVQDDSGSTNNGVVASEATLQRLVDAIADAGGPLYSWAYITPQNNQDGGQTGGNIRQVFLYNSERVQLADSSVGGSTESVVVSDNNGEPDLSVSVGRIDPTDPAFAHSRKPLVAEFVFNGESVFVINNHFNSKIGDDPLFGINQPPVEVTEAQRLLQAQIVADFVEQLLAIDPDANVAVVGDLNDFGFSDSVGLIEGAGLANLTNLLPVNERYDYVFQGNSQQLDHILVSGNLGEEGGFDILHVNAEFAEQTSDHDPLIARLNIAEGLVISGGNGDDVIVGGVGNDRLDGGRGADVIMGGNGKDLLIGGQGDDALFGGNAADILVGGQGSDLLDGGSGNDLLAGGKGDDLLTGGEGADQFNFGSNGGSDIVSDYETGIDSLSFDDGIGVRRTAAQDVDGDGNLDLILSLTGNGGSVILLGVASLADVGIDAGAQASRLDHALFDYLLA